MTIVMVDERQDGNHLYVIMKDEKFFAGYNWMGGDEWTNKLMDADWMEYPDVQMVMEDLVAAE